MNMRRERFQGLGLKFGSELKPEKKKRFLELEQCKKGKYYTRSWWHLPNISASDEEIATDSKLNENYGFKRRVKYTYNTKLLDIIQKKGHITVEYEKETQEEFKEIPF